MKTNKHNANHYHLLHHHHHHHKIGSFNCLRLQPIHEASSANHSKLNNQNTSSSSSLGRNHKAKESSPKVGCIGQIKRSSSQKQCGNGSTKLMRIKRLFSLKRVEDDDQVRNQGVGIADTMDTPLPVFKKCVTVRDVDIWKRRHGGGAVLRRIDVGDVKLRQIQKLRRSFSVSRLMETC